MPNPAPEDLAFLEVLNRPILPELSINLIDALTRAFQLTRSRNPTITAQQFITHILAAGLCAEMDEWAARRLGLKPERYILNPIEHG